MDAVPPLALFIAMLSWVIASREGNVLFFAALASGLLVRLAARMRRGRQ